MTSSGRELRAELCGLLVGGFERVWMWEGIPGLGNDDVVHGSMAFPEAGEADADDHWGERVGRTILTDGREFVLDEGAMRDVLCYSARYKVFNSCEPAELGWVRGRS